MRVFPRQVRGIRAQVRRGRDTAHLEGDQVVRRDAKVLGIVVERQDQDWQSLAFLEFSISDISIKPPVECVALRSHLQHQANY